MTRFVVPATLVALIGTLGLGLIFGIVGRSPQTHSNVFPDGFDRLPVIYIGRDVAFAGFGTAPAADSIADPAVRGKVLFVTRGCATCHGVGSHGGVLGPDLDLVKLELWREDFGAAVRSGPGGMPIFTVETLSDADLDAIYAFLKARP
jgi:hypothetical protein